MLQENSLCSIFLRHYGQHLRRVYGTQRFPNPHMLLIQNGCAMIRIFVRSIMFPTRQKRVFLAFSTHDRKRSKPRRNNSRRHTRSRCMTSVCASGIPTAMSLRSKKTILRGRLPINHLLRPSLPPTTRTLPREFPGEPSTPAWPMTSRSGTILRKP